MKSTTKAINSIGYYQKKYGTKTAIRALNHFIYRFFKKYFFNKSESHVNVHGYDLLKIPNDPGISSELTIFKIHEPVNTKVISKLLHKGMTCIDIGGNIGYYVFLERKLVGDSGQIITFEPLRRNFEYLEKNIQNHKFKNITTYNFACGNRDDEMTFFINKKSNGCQVIREGVTPPDPSLGTLSSVPVRILDPIIEDLKLSRVDFIRMDVEGFELNILKGLKKTIEKFKPIISLELHKRQLGVDGTIEFFEFMKNYDYKIESYVPRDLDVPLIGTLNDVQKPKIDDLIQMVKTGKTGSYLMLNLVSNSKK